MKTPVSCSSAVLSLLIMESTLCEAALNPLHWLQVMINHYAELPDWKLTRTRLTHWTYDLLWQESCVQSRAEINFLPAVSAAHPSGALRYGHPGPGGGSSSGRTHSRVGTHRCRDARKLPTKILQRLTAGRKKEREREREREGKVKKKKRWDRQSANCAVDTSGYLKGFSHLSPLHNFKKICFMKSLVWYLSQSSDGSRGVQTRNQ